MVTNIDVICEVLTRDGYKIETDENGNKYVKVDDDNIFLFNYYSSHTSVNRTKDTSNITYNDVMLAIKNKARYIKDIYRTCDEEWIKYSWE